MKNILFLFVFACFSLFFAQRSDAQCYVRLEDASGFNTDAYQDTLQAAAAKLCAIFDTTGFAGQFKVYDFGFYLHQENTTGGYPEPFAQKMAEVQALSPYYLLFGKQTDKSGVYTRFWVDLVLPDTGKFTCLEDISPSLREGIIEKIKISTNLKYEELGYSHDKYNEVEIATIDSLRNLLSGFLSCCYYRPRGGNSCSSCIYTTSEIKQYFERKGFTAYEITMQPGSQRNDSANILINNRINNTIILHDYANTTIYMNGIQSNIGQNAYTDCLKYPPQSLSIKIVVTNNETFCSNFEEVDSDLSGNNYDIFSIFHIWRETPNSNNAILFHKIEENVVIDMGNFVLGYIHIDPATQNSLSGLIDFEYMRLTTSVIFGTNGCTIPIALGDKSPLNTEECWTKIVKESIHSSSYPYQGNSPADDLGNVDKTKAYVNYNVVIYENNGENLNKLQKSYMMGFVIAHEFLHELLMKSFAFILTAGGNEGPSLLRGNVFKFGHGIHYDCNINLNSSGPRLDITPYEVGQNPSAETIDPSHLELINQYFECVSTREFFGSDSQTYRLLVDKYYRELNEGAISKLIDGCPDPSYPNEFCNCLGN